MTSTKRRHRSIFWLFLSFLLIELIKDPKPAGKLLLNFDDDDEEEEEEPQQKSTPLKIITSKTAEVESGQSKNSASLKSNTLLSAQTTSFQPKSVGLPAPKTTETPVKSSGLPPALAAKLAALNSKKEASTGSSLGQSGSAQKKDSALIYNDDEIEDIGKKYTSVNKTGIVLEKPKADNSEVYSRYKMSASGNANNSPSLAEKQDKGKNDAVWVFPVLMFVAIIILETQGKSFWINSGRTSSRSKKCKWKTNRWWLQTPTTRRTSIIWRGFCRLRSPSSTMRSCRF